MTMYFIFGGVIFVLALVTDILLVVAIRKLNRSNVCVGTIIGFSGGQPVVEYEVDGEYYEFHSNFSSSTMRQGKEVDVIYDKNDVTKAEMKKSVLFVPMVTGFITAVWIFIMAILVLCEIFN